MSARITRTIDTDLDAGELWSLVADGDGWAEWLVDDADLDVTPGAEGTVVDDGEERGVRIDRVEPDRTVAFTWWPHTRPEQVSTVELVVVPARTGSRLHVTERYLRASAAPAALAWDVRAVLLQARAVTVLV